MNLHKALRMLTAGCQKTGVKTGGVQLVVLSDMSIEEADPDFAAGREGNSAVVYWNVSCCL